MHSNTRSEITPYVGQRIRYLVGFTVTMRNENFPPLLINDSSALRYNWSMFSTRVRIPFQ